jgi:hypothetical protein
VGLFVVFFVASFVVFFVASFVVALFVAFFFPSFRLSHLVFFCVILIVLFHSLFSLRSSCLLVIFIVMFSASLSFLLHFCFSYFDFPSYFLCRKNNNNKGSQAATVRVRIWFLA